MRLEKLYMVIWVGVAAMGWVGPLLGVRIALTFATVMIILNSLMLMKLKPELKGGFDANGEWRE